MKTTEENTKPVKEAYQKPELKKFGHTVELTQGLTVTPGDAVVAGSAA